MLKGATLVTALLVATVEPALGESDPIRYAITQGGLLCVALVLLWYIKGQHKVALSVEHSARADADRTIKILTDLVAQMSATMQRSIDGNDATKEAIHRLAKAVDKLDERRSGGERRSEGQGR